MENFSKSLILMMSSMHLLFLISVLALFLSMLAGILLFKEEIVSSAPHSMEIEAYPP